MDLDARLDGRLFTAATSTGISLGLSYRPPHAWDHLLAFLAARAIPGVEMVEDGVYRRTIELGGVAGEIAVANEPARSRLRASIVFPHDDALPTILARLRRLFDLDADPRGIDAALSRDPRLAPLVAARPGLRVPGAWDGFELGVRAIVGQQITVSAATRLLGGIAREHGAWREHGPAGLDRLFPTPDGLAVASLGGMPKARAKAIGTLAAMASTEARLFDRGADLHDSVERLCRLPGIGPWTAHYVAMRAMGEPDAFPTGDVALMRALNDGAGRPSAAEMTARAEAWRPWRAYAALHLWASLEPRAPRPAAAVGDRTNRAAAR